MKWALKKYFLRNLDELTSILYDNMHEIDASASDLRLKDQYQTDEKRKQQNRKLMFSTIHTEPRRKPDETSNDDVMPKNMRPVLPSSATDRLRTSLHPRISRWTLPQLPDLSRKPHTLAPLSPESSEQPHLFPCTKLPAARAPNPGRGVKKSVHYLTKYHDERTSFAANRSPPPPTPHFVAFHLAANLLCWLNSPHHERRPHFSD